MTKKTNLFGNLKSDFSSGLVVFLVALPLCLGIALASGAPPLSGIIAGIFGGIIVGMLSKSHISVSGPAAGLTAIVLDAIHTLQFFEVFLLAVVLAGIFQLILGFLKAGSISNYFPNNVIEGMLAGIGIIIILKQIPHAVGYDKDFEGDEAFLEKTGNTIESLFSALNNLHFGAIIIALSALAVLICWEKVHFLRKIKIIPGALVAVILGIILNQIFKSTGSNLAISEDHLVNLPVPKSFDDFASTLIFPDFEAIGNSQVWVLAAIIATVASVETLLCIEASDRMDSQKRYTDTNVELKAQGIGNVLSGLIGGLPMTSVVVRSSANANAGAKSKMSTIIHGFLLMICVLSIPALLNRIPLATLAAVLLMVGYKLAVPNIKHFADLMPEALNFLILSIILSIVTLQNTDNLYLKITVVAFTVCILTFVIFKMHRNVTFLKTVTRNQYIYFPFFATTIAVVFTDLLKGVGLGILISIIFILRGNLKRAYHFKREKFAEGDIIHIDLAQEVSFLNKAAIKSTLMEIPENSTVIIDASDTEYIAHDVLDLIQEFASIKASDENIKVTLKGFKTVYQLNDLDDLHNHVNIEKR